MTDLKAIVVGIYDAFGRGDIPAILEQLAEDVQWEHWSAWSPHTADVTWLLPRNGRAGAAEFFQILGSWNIRDFQVLDLLASERQVAAEVVIEVEFPSGASYRDEELHLWAFNGDGKVTRFRHYVDTAKHIAAYRGDQAGHTPGSQGS